MDLKQIQKTLYISIILLLLISCSSLSTQEQQQNYELYLVQEKSNKVEKEKVEVKHKTPEVQNKTLILQKELKQKKQNDSKPQLKVTEIVTKSSTVTPIPTTISKPTPTVTPVPQPLTMIKTVTVAPDENLKIPGAFCRINYVPVTDNFLVTFGGTAHGTQGYGYKWYTQDLEFTGEWGLFQERGTDTASVMVDNTYYFLTNGGKNMWSLKKFDPITWTLQEQTLIKRNPNKEFGNDPMLVYVNGMLDVSGLYTADGQGSLDQKKTNPRKGETTHHRFFTNNLEFLEYRVLSDTPHINGSSMVYVDGVYNMVTSTAFFGNLIVMRYDKDWNYLGSKILAQGGNWSMGIAYNEEQGHFYVTYLDDPPRSLTNVRLAIFDTDWNSIANIAVTQYADHSFSQTGRPWVILHNHHVYVSFDTSTMNPKTMEENKDWECTVSLYEITN